MELHRAVSVEFGGHQAHPGLIDQQYALLSAIQRPQATVFGRDAYPSFPDKAAALVFALLQNRPFKSANRRLAVTALIAFCELNDRPIDSRVLDEKAMETLIKRASGNRDANVDLAVIFRELRESLARAIGPAMPA